jgi:hypothetical protein
VSLAFQLAAKDSTGQRITLIVIGLLLAALALAFLTVWYYRVTDPGPSQHKRRGGNPGPPGGTGSSSPRSPRTSSWKDRLSGFSLPTIPVRSSKRDVSSATPSEAVRATAPVSDPGSRPASNAPVTTPTATPSKQTTKLAGEPPKQSPPAPVQPEASDGAVEKVSLEGGFYIDLTEVSQTGEPPTNVGSLNSLDLRQPAPLVDPDQAPVPEPAAVPVSTAGVSSAENGGTVSFDDWLAEVEATEDQ